MSIFYSVVSITTNGIHANASGLTRFEDVKEHLIERFARGDHGFIIIRTETFKPGIPPSTTVQQLTRDDVDLQYMPTPYTGE